MNVWSRVMKALQGGVSGLGDVLVDSQALRILEQEVREAAEDLKASKEHLAAVNERQKVVEDRCAKLQDRIKEYEDYAIQALNKEDEMLALEVAQKVAEFELELEEDKLLLNEIASSAQELKIAIKQTEYSIRRIKQQADSVQATVNALKAQETVAKRQGATKVATAMESLERIKKKQALNTDGEQTQSKFTEGLKDAELDAKLKAAGIIKSAHSAKEVLDRIKNER